MDNDDSISLYASDNDFLEEEIIPHPETTSIRQPTNLDKAKQRQPSPRPAQCQESITLPQKPPSLLSIRFDRPPQPPAQKFVPIYRTPHFTYTKRPPKQ